MHALRTAKNIVSTSYASDGSRSRQWITASRNIFFMKSML